MKQNYIPNIKPVCFNCKRDWKYTYQREYKRLIEEYEISSFVKQHQPSGVKRILDGIATYSQVKSGNLKRGEGDVVIVNLFFPDNLDITLEDYLKYFLDIQRIETKGIFTNLYFSNHFFGEVIKDILKNTQ